MRPSSSSNRYARRSRVRSFAFWSVGLFIGLLSLDAAAQFNARGRGPRGVSRGQSTSTKVSKPKTAPVSAKTRRATLIARYEKLIFTQPGEDVPLTRLAELVRKRDGNLDKLLKMLEQAAQDPTKKYAALIAWGGVLSKDERRDEASAKLKEATRLEPRRPQAWQLLGTIQKANGKPKEARASFEQALPHVRGPERSLLVRTLRDLSLDDGDYEAASKHHRTLVREARGNLFLQGELGRELLRRGQTERAVRELQRVVDQAQGDSRAVAPALRDLGTAQLAAKKSKEAIDTLRRASRLAVASPGLRAAIDTLRAEAHRDDGSLPEFLDELSRTAASAPRLGLLGRLYEEAGETGKAVGAYRKALKIAPRDIDLRLRLVRLYEVTGNIKGAVDEYGRLVKSSPRDVQLSLRYAEMLLAQGSRQKAVGELDRIDRLTAQDPEAGLMLLDFAERLEEQERSKRILARLSQANSRDARFLVELGARYYQNGDTKAARRTWKRILTVNHKRAEAHMMLGEVLIDHEAVDEGVEELRKAARLDSNNPQVKKALALGLERAASQAPGKSKSTYERDALSAWKELLRDQANTDAPTAEQMKGLARRHIVRIWKRTGRLAESVLPLEVALKGSPPDLDAGRLLAEAYIGSRADQRAVEVLEELLRHAPGDRGVLLSLEAAHVRMSHHSAAISVLKKLVEADPRRAREYYERMARAAAMRNDQKAALHYAELAVAKNPTDPVAQGSLGDLYLTQGRLQDAEKAYRRALAKDDRLHRVNLRLADILAKTDRAEEALKVLFHVVRSARNQELIAKAARRAIAMSLPLKSEKAVENVLRPLAIAHPEQPLYRSLLLEILSSQMYPLLLARSHGADEKRTIAGNRLSELADRSTGPLLTALSGKNAGEQQIAISLLAHSKTNSAATGLLAFAESSANEEQRLLAVLALGRFPENTLSSRLGEMVVADGTPQRGRIARAAIWALSQRRANSDLFTKALTSSDPEVRTYAALALGDSSLKGRPRQAAISALIATVADPHGGVTPRAAAALALSHLIHPTTNETQKHDAQEALLGAFSSRSTQLVQTSLMATSRLLDDTRAHPKIAEGLLSLDPLIRKAAKSAAIRLDPRYGREKTALLPRDLSPEQLDGQARVDAAIREKQTRASPAERHQALSFLQRELIEQARVNLRSSPEAAAATLEQIRTGASGPLFGSLLIPEDYGSPSSNLQQAQEAAKTIRSSLSDEIIALASGPNPALAAQALHALEAQDGPAAQRTFAQQLRAPSSALHQAALSSLAKKPSDDAITLLERYLVDESSWGRRRRAASAVGAMLKNTRDANLRDQLTRLLEKLATDASDLVRAEATTQLNRVPATP